MGFLIGYNTIVQLYSVNRITSSVLHMPTLWPNTKCLIIVSNIVYNVLNGQSVILIVLYLSETSGKHIFI